MQNYFGKLLLKIQRIQFGRGLILRGIPIVYKKKNSTIRIGENCVIKSSFFSNLVGLYQKTIIVTRTPDAKIDIGDNVGISGATIYARKSIIIGDNTCIGGNVKILDNDFHPINWEIRNELLLNKNGGEMSEFIPSKEVTIGKNCFIGCNSIILKGTVLGDGCVVGAGAVVCGQYPSYSVIAGNPAKVIKTIN